MEVRHPLSTTVTRPRRGAEGFTLVEVLVALVILGAAVVGIVGVMSSIVLGSEHEKGSAVTSDVLHSFSEAIKFQAAHDPDACADVGGSNCSADADTADDAASGVDDDTTQATQDTSAFIPCPSQSDVFPNSAYFNPLQYPDFTLIAGNLTVDYSNPATGAFIMPSQDPNAARHTPAQQEAWAQGQCQALVTTCLSQFQGLPSPLATCLPSVYRVTIDVTAVPANERGTKGENVILVRRGNG